MNRKAKARRPDFVNGDCWATIDKSEQIERDLADSMLELLMAPEPPSEIIIERGLIYWFQRFEDYRLILINPETLQTFPSNLDPMTVTLALKAKANGPINVVWNL